MQIDLRASVYTAFTILNFICQKFRIQVSDVQNSKQVENLPVSRSKGQISPIAVARIFCEIIVRMHQQQKILKNYKYNTFNYCRDLTARVFSALD